MKRQVVLYGAFDRYNYGDNLMPILLERYLREFHSDKLTDVEFVYSSIKASDLSYYKCMPTKPMLEVLNTVAEGATIIVVGGEVLGASVGVLYTHVQHSTFMTRFLRLIGRICPPLLNTISKYSYHAVWNYPYLPSRSSFKKSIKIVYNTVGGNPPSSEKHKIIDADYISVRDQRTFDNISEYSNPKLVPDSVLLASSVINDDFFEREVREEFKILNEQKYICIQACPYKVKFSAEELAREIDRIIFERNIQVILLPIGYASGHDDLLFLKKVNSLVQNDILLFDDLNVWEIMYIISHSSAFFGTSLHGVITAMSFLIPHFSINKDIAKLTSFLNTWSVPPFDTPIEVTSICEVLNLFGSDTIVELNHSVNQAKSIISSSINDIAEIL
ncbi:polysaccharide pyruvyl transferase family protein [Klebsiella indica]|uniref:polysaccharide pyruvyl transferase family protein n=1 Tax=Klebsiella TaxID=570 RepID=UPI003751FE22